MERTLVLIKPDAVRRALIGRILARFEDKGLLIVAMRMLSMTSDMAEMHYAEHKNKPFFEALKQFIMSGPLVALVLEGAHSIEIVRHMAGLTDAGHAEPGTIRGDFSTNTRANLVHASDCIASAQREIALFFPDQR